MILAATGFVSAEAGSVASANALLLMALLNLGYEIDFFSKPSFVDPRPVIGSRPNFRFVPTINSLSGAFSHRVKMIPVMGFAAERNDAAAYNRLLLKKIGQAHQNRRYNAALWLGDYAHHSTLGLPTVSFAQGAPGTDARSILKHYDEIKALAGFATALKWKLLAHMRLSTWGLPKFGCSDHFIVGSKVAKDRLTSTYHIPAGSISTLPYPIDLDLFAPLSSSYNPSDADHLRILWLGRIIPRKRLSLLLDAAKLAIHQGLNLTLTIVGGVGFIPGYQKLLDEFPFPERLRYLNKVPRSDVPRLMSEHDVLAQPSEEENFGSSAAEAQACGLPVIVGQTNGNADYLCSRDIHLKDDLPETLANVLSALSERKRSGIWGEPQVSRQFAIQTFNIATVAQRLAKILEQVGQPTIP